MIRSPAKFAAPLPGANYTHPVLELALHNRFSIFTAPSGYLPTAQLAAVAQSMNASLVWLRAGEEDRDPGILLVSLIQALRKTLLAGGTDTLAAMRRQPGPVGGWAVLFAIAARDFSEALPGGGALVIEHAGKLAGSTCMELLGAHFLPLLRDSINVIVLTHELLPPGSFPIQAQRFRERDLQISEQTGLELSRHLAVHLPDQTVRRVILLGGGRPGLVENLALASNAIGREAVARSIQEAGNLDDLLLRLSRIWMNSLNPATAAAALVAIQLRDFHPEMLQSVIAAQLPEETAWLQKLSGDWQHVLCGWVTPLRMALRTLQHTNPNLLLSIARQMEKEGLVEQAVRYYLELGEYPRAAQVISGLANDMLDLGQWQTLATWLGRLPASVQHEWPWLVYAAGEMAAARKDGPAARRLFSQSTELFRNRRSAEGVCQSLLTESVLAAWQGEYTQALNTAHAARSEAREAGLQLYEAYANWQAGCLYADQASFETALQFFEECRQNAQGAGAPLVADLAERIKALIAQRIELARQSEHLRKQADSLHTAQEDLAHAIQSVLSSPASNLNQLLAQSGWSRTPLNLKAHSFEFASPPTSARGLSSLWKSLLSVFHFSERGNDDLPASLSVTLPDPTPIPIQAPESPAEPLPLAQAPEVVIQPIRQDPAQNPSPLLTAYLLGPFQVSVDEKLITGWSGGRGRTLFQYLLAHHNRPRKREELMAVFWPESSEKAARNNLNVAVHALRQAVRQVTVLSVIVYSEGMYRINPAFDLWLDVDVFERELETARQSEAAGNLPAAVRALEAAANLYQDDFLSTDPYEEWTLPVRERLRMIYLEALDRLSGLHFDQGQYATAATLCQRLLARDACREDAHCRLMLCYTYMGERHLALRQFQVCSDALRAELNTAPSLTTMQIFQKIRRQE